MRMAKARIAVIGAGLMGHGIAQVFALAGHEVSIHDSIAANLDSAKAYGASPELRAAMQGGGIEGPPEISFLDDVEDRRY